MSDNTSPISKNGKYATLGSNRTDLPSSRFSLHHFNTYFSPIPRFTADLCAMLFNHLSKCEDLVSAGMTVGAGFLYAACYLLLKRRKAKKAKMVAEGATSNVSEGDQSLDTIYIF
jgi:hypothetical protein